MNTSPAPCFPILEKTLVSIGRAIYLYNVPLLLLLSIITSMSLLIRGLAILLFGVLTMATDEANSRHLLW